MILSGDFFYHGQLRWNLGWPTPNYAGAFVATLLALAFAFSGSRWRWTALALEAGGLFLLAKTIRAARWWRGSQRGFLQ